MFIGEFESGKGFRRVYFAVGKVDGDDVCE